MSTILAFRCDNCAGQVIGHPELHIDGTVRMQGCTVGMSPAKLDFCCLECFRRWVKNKGKADNTI